MKINYRCYVPSFNCYVDLISINLENQEVKFKNNEKLCSLSFNRVVLQQEIIDGLFEGDIITSEEYPFTSNGDKNYVGIVKLDIDGAYYEPHKISDRVGGHAVGDSISELRNFKVIGNIYNFKIK